MDFFDHSDTRALDVSRAGLEMSQMSLWSWTNDCRNPVFKVKSKRGWTVWIVFAMAFQTILHVISQEILLKFHSNRIAMILVHGGGHFCCVPRLSSWPWKKQTPPNNPTFVWYFTGRDLHQVSWCAAGISGIDEVKCIEATTVLWFNVASMIDEWWWMQMNQWMHFFLGCMAGFLMFDEDWQRRFPFFFGGFN